MKKAKAQKKPAPKPKRVAVDLQPKKGATVYTKKTTHEEAARLRDLFGYCVIRVDGEVVTVAADSEAFRKSRG